MSDTRLRPWHAHLLFLVTSLAFVAPALFLGSSMGAVENVTLFPPFAESMPSAPEVGIGLQGDQAVQLGIPAEFYRSLRSGDVQLWEPDIAGGSPMFTGVYNRVLSPLNWIFLVLPATLATTASAFLSVLIAQVGTFWLARRLGLGVAGAMVGGVVYGFCGPLMSAMLRYHEMFLLPTWLFAIHGVITDSARRWGFAALTAVMTALIWLSGFPAAAVMSTYLAAAFTVYLLVSGMRDLPITPAKDTRAWRARARFALSSGALVALAVAAGLAIAAVQLLPTLEFLDTTLARTRRYEGGFLPSATLSNMLSGRFFGAEQDADWWYLELVNVIESGSTFGLVALSVLATMLLGLKSSASRLAERPLAAFVMPTALLLILADYFGGPVLSAFLSVPILNESLFTRSRFIAFLMLSLCVGYGVDRLIARDAGGKRPGLILRAELLIGVIALLVGVRHGVGAALVRNAVRAVAVDMIVPVVMLLAATAAVLLLRRRPAVLTLALCLAVAVELQWGAFGLTPFSRAGEFYPEPDAVAVLADDVSSGGQFRFFDRANLALYGGTPGYLGLRDALANWPASGAYQQVIELSDPGVAATSADKAVFEPTFTPALDLGSPALNAAAVGWYVAPLSEPLTETGRPVRLARAFDGDSAVAGETVPVVRGIVVDPMTRDPDCLTGFVALTVDGVTSRRPVRDVGIGGPFAFPLPDMVVTKGSTIDVTTTDCAVDLSRATAIAQVPQVGTNVRLISVDGWQAYRRPGALPRVGMARSAVTVAGAADRLHQLATRTDPHQVILSGAGPQGPFGPASATLVEDGNDVVRINVDSNGPGLLVLRDVNSPGWTATVDGQSVAVLEADHAFRAVEVPDGTSTVEFNYFPPALRTGIMLAVAGLLLVLGLLGVHLRTTRRRLEIDGGAEDQTAVPVHEPDSGPVPGAVELDSRGEVRMDP